MSDHKNSSELVRSGFTAQQFVLIIATFLLGAASATVFNELFIERSFGPVAAVASQDSNESR